MNNLVILTVLFVSVGITSLRADDKPLFTPRPTKDPVASKKHSQGAGIFEIILRAKFKQFGSGAAQMMYCSMLML
jgi:hypothetical protein